MLNIQFILDRRKQLGLSQQMAADKAEMFASYWTRLETGSIPNPKLETLATLARVLQCDIGDLVLSPCSDKDDSKKLQKKQAKPKA